MGSPPEQQPDPEPPPPESVPPAVDTADEEEEGEGAVVVQRERRQDLEPVVAEDAELLREVDTALADRSRESGRGGGPEGGRGPDVLAGDEWRRKNPSASSRSASSLTKWNSRLLSRYSGGQN